MNEPKAIRLSEALRLAADKFDKLSANEAIENQECVIRLECDDSSSESLTLQEREPVLANRARQILAARRDRAEMIPMAILGEPAWDMLLDLYVQSSNRVKVSVSSLCVAANSPPTTALRYVGLLEDAELVCRIDSKFDKRVSYVELTDIGYEAVATYLSETL